MSGSVWTVEPALMVERIAAVLPSSASIALVKEPARQVQIIDVDVSVVLRLTPSGDRWIVRAWAAEPGHDEVTSELALEVLIAGVSEPTLIVSVGCEDVLRAHFSSELKPAAMWSYLYRVMEDARLMFDSQDLRAKVPALSVDSAFLERGEWGIVRLSGTWEGYPFDFKVQYGSASLTVGPAVPSGGLLGLSSDTPLWFAGMYFDTWDSVPEQGQLPSWAEVTAVFTTLAQRIERAPFIYLFTRVRGKEEETPWESAGQTPRDAFENLISRVARLREQGYLVGEEYGPFRPDPINRDMRKFPQTLPLFEVRPSL